MRLELPRHAVDIVRIALPGLGQLLGRGQQLLSVRVGVLKETLYGFFNYILLAAKHSQVQNVVFTLFEVLVQFGLDGVEKNKETILIMISDILIKVMNKELHWKASFEVNNLQSQTFLKFSFRFWN